MKTLDFFIDKANEYSNEIDEIVNNYISRYSEEAFENSPEYTKQKLDISDLKLKIKLLFSEFDNGELFKSEIIKADESGNYTLKDDELLKVYKHILSLFVDHIVEFRK